MMMSFNNALTVRGQNAPSTVTLGYNLDLLQHGIKSKLNMPLNNKDNIHTLIIGSSGSGKSYALHRLISLLQKAEPQSEILFANYKGDETFSYLKNLPRYFEYKNTIQALEIIYNELCFRLSGEKTNKYPIITLVWDEYISNILALLAEDKKFATLIMNRVSEILLMGRSLSIRLILATQRPDSVVFSMGSREQFGYVLALGMLSKEVKQMMFSDFKEDFEDRVFLRG